MNNTRNEPDDCSCDRRCLMAISITCGCTTGGLIVLSIALLIYMVKCPKVQMFLFSAEKCIYFVSVSVLL